MLLAEGEELSKGIRPKLLTSLNLSFNGLGDAGLKSELISSGALSRPIIRAPMATTVPNNSWKGRKSQARKFMRNHMNLKQDGKFDDSNCTIMDLSQAFKGAVERKLWVYRSFLAKADPKKPQDTAPLATLEQHAAIDKDCGELAAGFMIVISGQGLQGYNGVTKDQLSTFFKQMVSELSRKELGYNKKRAAQMRIKREKPKKNAKKVRCSLSFL